MTGLPMRRLARCSDSENGDVTPCFCSHILVMCTKARERENGCFSVLPPLWSDGLKKKPPYLLVIIEGVHKSRATEFCTLAPNIMGRPYGTNSC